MIQHQVMNGELTNEITNNYMNEIEEDNCKKKLKCGDEADCERTNIENLCTQENIEKYNMFNRNERSRRVEKKEADNEQCE